MEIPRYWRLKQQRYGLVGDVCSNGHPAFPPDDVCKICDPNVAIAEAIRLNNLKRQEEMRKLTKKGIGYLSPSSSR